MPEVHGGNRGRLVGPFKSKVHLESGAWGRGKRKREET